MYVFGLRIREERERLELTQDKLAGNAGVTVQSQRNYESGKRKPDAEYLEAFASLGADVTYILTGERIYDPELKQLKSAERAKAVLQRVVDIQASLGVEFSKEQLQALMGYAFDYCPTQDALESFVRAAFEMNGTPLPEKQDKTPM